MESHCVVGMRLGLGLGSLGRNDTSPCYVVSAFAIKT